MNKKMRFNIEMYGGVILLIMGAISIFATANNPSLVAVHITTCVVTVIGLGWSFWSIMQISDHGQLMRS